MRYTKLKHLTKEIKQLQKLGVVSTTVLRDMEMFEYFHTLDSNLCVYCRYELAGENFGISSDRAKSIILKLKN